MGWIVDEGEKHATSEDGKLTLRFQVGASVCDGCYVHGRRIPEGLPCSPGTRKDGKHGIWRL